MSRSSTSNLFPTLWHICFSGIQTVKPHQSYWFDNHLRTPNKCVTLQISLHGSITYKDKNRIYKVPPNHLLMFVFGEKSSYGRPEQSTSSTAYKNMWLTINGAGLYEHINLFRKRFSPVIDLSSETSFIDKMKNIIDMTRPNQQQPPALISHRIHHLITNLFMYADQQRSISQTPVDRAVDSIINQPTYPWSLKSLAASVGCSREYFSRYFTERIGTPPATYLRNLRVERAIQLLDLSSLSLDQIATSLGYTSTHTLARQIKEHTGMSPTQYRNT